MIRYAEDRYLNIELILEDESGLKIPKTAVVTRNFSIVPRDYLTTGGNGSSTGVLLLDDDGNAVFKEIDIYNISEDDEVYVSLSDIKTGDVLIKPNRRKHIVLMIQKHLKVYIILTEDMLCSEK